MRQWKNPPAPGKTKVSRWLYDYAVLVICLGIPAILALIGLLT
jgi:hypothetical protein